ncbi:MAG: hypothetical protein ABIJ61_07370, partial [bacterium]
LAIVMLAVGISLLPTSQSFAIERTPNKSAWALDIGSGWFEPHDEFYDEWFDHGINFQLGLSYKFPSRLILGLQYRYAEKNEELFYYTLDYYYAWDDYFIYAPQLKTMNHWIGIRLGYDIVERGNAEISLSGIAYLVESIRQNRYCDYEYFAYAGNEFDFGDRHCQITRDGVGLGATFIFAYDLNQMLALGLEVEYNYSWLDETGPVFSNSPDKVGTVYHFENVGGFWLAPFVRLNF